MYRTLMVDWPWRYPSPGWLGGSDRHYPTLPPAAAFDMPIPNIVHPDAHLWFWTPEHFYRTGEAAEIIKTWGFTPKMTFNWLKLEAEPMTEEQWDDLPNKQAKYGEEFWYPILHNKDFYLPQWGNGYYGRSDMEYCLFAVAGKNIPPKHKGRQIHRTFKAPVGEHSEKPNAIYDLIKRFDEDPSLAWTPERLDIFARDTKPGFDVWGNDVIETANIPLLDEWGEKARKLYPEKK